MILDKKKVNYLLRNWAQGFRLSVILQAHILQKFSELREGYQEIKLSPNTLGGYHVTTWLGQTRVHDGVHHEPITQSEQLPYQAYVTAFLWTSLFLDTFQGTFSRENKISAIFMNPFEYDISKRETKRYFKKGKKCHVQLGRFW